MEEGQMERIDWVDVDVDVCVGVDDVCVGWENDNDDDNDDNGDVIDDVDVEADMAVGIDNQDC